MGIHDTEGGPTMATAANSESSASAFSGDLKAQTLASTWSDYLGRVKGGDMGVLPALGGLLTMVVIFTALRPETFLSPLNLANLTTQAGSVCVLALALIPILIIGEIDLSAAVAGSTLATIATVLIETHHWPWTLALLTMVGLGTIWGLLVGLAVTRLGIPSFIVTLAVFLALQGVLLKLVGEGVSLAITNEYILGVENSNLPVWLGWVMVVLVAGGAAIAQLLAWKKKNDRGVQRPPLALVGLRIAGLTAALVTLTAVMSIDRSANASVTLAGIPYVVPLVIILLLLWTFIFGHTAYGRHVYAVGGNAEAARRAGINVSRVRISVFALCTVMAGIAGLIDASRLSSVSPQSGTGTELLYAIGAAVIGGASLFGGRGKMRDGILGGLVIAMIPNGLGLLNQLSYVNYLVTGGVLLLAATVDAASRRRRGSVGR
jgi:D-xylose transport system permease protein